MKLKFNSLKRSLKADFALLTSILICVIMMCILMFATDFIKQINNQISIRSYSLNETAASLLLKSIKENIKDGNFDNLDQEIQWSFYSHIIASIVIKDSNNQIKYFSKDLVSESTYKEIKKLWNYTVEINFYETPILVGYLQTFRQYLNAFVIVFIGLGFLLAKFLSNIIISPINTLIKSSNRIAKGDLHNRIEYSGYTEIDELIHSYNTMASNLEKSYNTMELKVQDRTCELKKALDELKQTQTLMVHSEKMKSIGELVAGITHEINNPLNFINGNLKYLEQYTNQLFELIETYNKFESDLKKENRNEIDIKKENMDFDYIKTDLPSLIKSCQEGAQRATNIVQNLKNFSRLEDAIICQIELPKEIESTLNILNYKLKNRIKVHKNYDESLPKIEGYGGQLNQVFMNILDNATFAIKNEGNIWIDIKNIKNRQVVIRIKDDGCGMDESVKDKIFNPFFTTKPVGSGTGLGMSISYKVIKNHNGYIKVDSIVGRGSTFIITLPVKQVIKEDTALNNSI